MASWSSRENGDAGAVGFQLDGGQECLLGVFFPLGDVVQGHRRGGVPGIALQDVDGQAELGEPGELGVAEPVGVAEPDGPALAVGDLDDLAELAQTGTCRCPTGRAWRRPGFR